MQKVPEIDIGAAKELLDESAAVFVDIRDPRSHEAAAIPGSAHITSQDELDTFCASTERDAAVIVYCYHGNASKGATMYLVQQGFTNVRSMAGGFEAWRGQFDAPR